jgi:hypothetical protein
MMSLGFLSLFVLVAVGTVLIVGVLLALVAVLYYRGRDKNERNRD